MWQSMYVERKMEETFVKLGAAYYGMWQSMIYIYINIYIYRKIAPFERLGWLAPARQLMIHETENLEFLHKYYYIAILKKHVTQGEGKTIMVGGGGGGGGLIPPLTPPPLPLKETLSLHNSISASSPQTLSHQNKLMEKQSTIQGNRRGLLCFGLLLSYK